MHRICRRIPASETNGAAASPLLRVLREGARQQRFVVAGEHAEAVRLVGDVAGEPARRGDDAHRKAQRLPTALQHKVEPFAAVFPPRGAVDREKAGLGRVVPRLRLRGQAVEAGIERDRDHARARVAVRVGIGPDLADGRVFDARFLPQLAAGGGLDRLLRLDKAAGQRPGADEGMSAPADKQHARSAVRMRKGGDVGRHRRAGIFARVVAGEEFGLSQAVFVSDSVSVFVSVSAHRSIHCFRFAEASFLPKCIENLCSGARNAEAGNVRAAPALAGRRFANAAFDAAAPLCLRFG